MQCHFDWILYILVHIIYICDGKCRQYLIILKGNNFRDYKPIVMNDVQWSYPYNISNEYKALQENRHCIINLQCLNIDAFHCTRDVIDLPVDPITDYVNGNKVDNANNSLSQDNYKIDNATGDTKFQDFENDHTTEVTLDSSNEHSENSHHNSESKDPNDFNLEHIGVKVNDSLPKVIQNTSVMENTTSHPNVEGGVVLGLTKENLKDIGVAVGCAVLGSLAFVLTVRQIRNCMQRGNYYLPDPLIDNPGV